MRSWVTIGNSSANRTAKLWFNGLNGSASTIGNHGKQFNGFIYLFIYLIKLLLFNNLFIFMPYSHILGKSLQF